jgi:hypothetical protein
MRLNLTESRLAELWDLARGNDASRDLLTADELSVFEQYQAIHESLVQPWQSAPNNYIELAKAIMPTSRRTFSIGRLVHPRPLLGFSRGAVSQIQFETDEVQVRIQIEQIPTGWRMWGRTSEPGWTIWSGPSSILCNADGEFELDVKTDTVEPLSIQNESMTILLPMIIDELGDGNG